MGTIRKHSDYVADFDNAAYLTLEFIPVSKSGHALCRKLGQLIAGDERGPNRRGRPENTEDIAQAAVLIVAETLDASKGDIRRSVYRGKSSNSFSGQQVSYRHFTRAMSGLEKLKFLSKTPGYWNKKSMFADVATPSSGFGKATRWQPTLKLVDLCEEEGITFRNVGDHFRIDVPKHPLELRQSARRMGRLKLKGTKIRFPETALTLKLEAEVREINEFLRGHRFEGASHRGYRRIFSLGDNPATYQWDKGGRLYGSGGVENYLTIKKELRQNILIDGEETVEIDIRASFMTIFHVLHGVEIDVTKDPYVIEGLPRHIAKSWVVAAFGSGKLPSRWSPEAGEAYRKASGHEKPLGKAFPMKIVTEKMLTALPVLHNLKEGGIDCFDLMYRESNALVASMLRLLRDDQVPSLCVHDSLIVKKGSLSLAVKVLKDEYHKAVGIIPHIKEV